MYIFYLIISSYTGTFSSKNSVPALISICCSPAASPGSFHNEAVPRLLFLNVPLATDCVFQVEHSYSFLQISHRVLMYTRARPCIFYIRLFILFFFLNLNLTLRRKT